MPLVALKRGWPTETFQRTIHLRDEAGKAVESRVMRFTKDPQEVTSEEFDALAKELEIALVEVKPKARPPAVNAKPEAAPAAPKSNDTNKPDSPPKPDSKPKTEVVPNSKPSVINAANAAR